MSRNEFWTLFSEWWWFAKQGPIAIMVCLNLYVEVSDLCSNHTEWKESEVQSVSIVAFAEQGSTQKNWFTKQGSVFETCFGLPAFSPAFRFKMLLFVLLKFFWNCAKILISFTAFFVMSFLILILHLSAWQLTLNLSN